MVLVKYGSNEAEKRIVVVSVSHWSTLHASRVKIPDMLVLYPIDAYISAVPLFILEPELRYKEMVKHRLSAILFTFTIIP